MAATKDSLRSLEQTPTWAAAVVCFMLISISIIIEFVIHLTGKWLTKRHKPALYEALEKIKSELMILGFISLLLTMGQGPVSDICISKAIAATWHPCSKRQDSNSDKGKEKSPEDDKCAAKGKVSLVSEEGIHQLHLFIFVLAISHILYCIATLALGRAKVRDNGRHGKQKVGQLNISSHMVCFFRQFFRSVPKVDYLTLRYGFIIAHLAPQSEPKFDFQKYIERSLEEDFKVIVGINPIIWFFAVLFLMFNTHGTYLWLPFLALIIILLVGTKLQVVITKMGIGIQGRGELVKGTPVVQPGNDHFWFNRPQLLLYLIHFVLFQNAFQLAFLAWTLYEFGLKSCFHEKLEDIIIRVSMGILIQILCSYVTLPLYALVTQMGSTMKPTILNDRVANALRKWQQQAKEHIKHNLHSGTINPVLSRPETPSSRVSPLHLLRNHGGELDNSRTSEGWEIEEADKGHILELEEKQAVDKSDNPSQREIDIEPVVTHLIKEQEDEIIL
ncbi:hypothetical protein REPUB_Repub02eG0248100 [Reevesia pubescens]